MARPHGKIVGHKVSRSERDKVCRSATDSTRYGLKAGVGRQASVTLTPRRSTETPLWTNWQRSGPDWRVPGVRTGGNLAERGPIKVNQTKSNHFFEAQDEMEGCSGDCGDGPSPPRRRWFPDSLCAKPAVGGARIYENLAKLKQIKVDQGELYLSGAGKDGGERKDESDLIQPNEGTGRSRMFNDERTHGQVAGCGGFGSGDGRQHDRGAVLQGVYPSKEMVIGFDRPCENR